MGLRQKNAVFPANAAGPIFAGTLASRAREVVHLLMALILALMLGACSSKPSWSTEEVAGHLPDLDFSLVADNGSAVTAGEFEGYLLLMYFGYTHCDAECPVSLARLARVVRMLGHDENRVRILFVSLDPARDIPEVLNKYIAQFDSRQTVGLTGQPADIERLAKQYRTAYRRGSKTGETTAIEHGDAIYIFDAKGHVRLLATSSNPDEHLVEDLRQLMRLGNL